MIFRRGETALIVIIHEGCSRDLFPLTGQQKAKVFYQAGGRQSLFEGQLQMGLSLTAPDHIVVLAEGRDCGAAREQAEHAGAEGISVLEDSLAPGSLLVMMKVYAYCRDILKADEEEVLIFSSADCGVSPKEAAVDFLKKAAARAGEGRMIGIEYAPLPGCEETQGKRSKVHMAAVSMKTLKRNIEETGREAASLLSLPYDDISRQTAENEAGTISGHRSFTCPSMILMKPPAVYACEVNTLEDFYEWLKQEDSDSSHNVLCGPVAAKDCSDSLILGGQRPMAVEGLHHYIAADTPEALVILPVGHGQEGQAMTAPYRKDSAVLEGVPVPVEWGTDCVLKTGDGWAVRCLVIRPGREVPRHMHRHMRECINVMSGEGTAFFDGKQRILQKNQCSLVPPGAWHRLVNTGQTEWIVISTMTV